VFFSDERYVALDNAESNFAGFKSTLFAKVPIPDSQIYKIHYTTHGGDTPERKIQNALCVVSCC
jgi:6-phosphogluconolactonase/glucosamine-6-phosphate isomerase/deaminase